MAKGYSERAGLVGLRKPRGGAGKRNGRLRKSARRLRNQRPKKVRRSTRNGK